MVAKTAIHITDSGQPIPSVIIDSIRLCKVMQDAASVVALASISGLEPEPHPFGGARANHYARKAPTTATSNSSRVLLSSWASLRANYAGHGICSSSYSVSDFTKHCQKLPHLASMPHPALCPSVTFQVSQSLNKSILTLLISPFGLQCSSSQLIYLAFGVFCSVTRFHKGRLPLVRQVLGDYKLPF